MVIYSTVARVSSSVSHIWKKLGAWIGDVNGSPLQYSCLEDPMDGGAWWAAVHGVAKSRTRLSSFTFTFHFHALEKEMATHSSVLAWRIPGTVKPGELSHRVEHDWSDLAAAAAVYICQSYSSQSSVTLALKAQTSSAKPHFQYAIDTSD